MMLSGFSKYLFGSDGKKSSHGNSATKASEIQQKINDWILVDIQGNIVSAQDEAVASGLEVQKEDESGQQQSQRDDSKYDEELIEFGMESSSEESARTSGDGPQVIIHDVETQSDTGLSDVSSQPEMITHPSVADCWLVTPPPCFTGGSGLGGEQLVVNPLENLLIEHPSMSVYVGKACSRRVNGRLVSADSLQGNRVSNDANNRQRKSNNNTNHGVSGAVSRDKEARIVTQIPNYTVKVNVDKIYRALACKNVSTAEWKATQKASNNLLTRGAIARKNLVVERNARGKACHGKSGIMQPSKSNGFRKS